MYLTVQIQLFLYEEVIQRNSFEFLRKCSMIQKRLETNKFQVNVQIHCSLLNPRTLLSLCRAQQNFVNKGTLRCPWKA